MSVQFVDFSMKHNVLIENEDGGLSHMDEPYFLPRQIAMGTWQILSDGDFSYLVEGDRESVVIDAGYGCGNIRTFCQSLTKRELHKVLNTHSHFDHTANNCYFDCAYMSAATAEKLSSIKKPSLEGVVFPIDYSKELIGEGYTFDLGGRKLETFEMPDHDVGSLVFLDRTEHILFCGDELPLQEKRLKGSVTRFCKQLEKLMTFRNDFDMLCTGAGIYPANLVNRYLENASHILAGYEGVKATPVKPTSWHVPGPCGETVYLRRIPRPNDQVISNDDIEYQRIMNYAGCTIVYDIRKL